MKKINAQNCRAYASLCTWNKELTEKENPSSDTLKSSEREELHRLHLEKREQAIEDGDRNHKKGDGLLRKRSKIVRYRFIDVEKTNYPIAILCTVMKVSRSGFYAWKEKPKRNMGLLKVTIKSIHEESVYRNTFKTKSEAKYKIVDYIDNFYNPKRQHNANHGLSPMEKEHRFYGQSQ